MGKEGVLLGFIEAVNFVNEKDSADFEVPVLFGAYCDGFNIFFASSDGGDFDKIGIEFMCENTSKGGFASSWRSPKNQVDWLTFFGDFGKYFAVTNDIFLTEDILESLWAHTFGERDSVHNIIITYL